MLLEVVTHCWRYSRLLMMQLGSFERFLPGAHRLKVNVCYCPEDTDSADVVDFFARRWDWLTPMPMERTHLVNRSIGRNRVATATEAAWVWFIDCDYCVGPGFLDRLATKLQDVRERDPLVKLLYTRRCRATTYELGAKLIEAARGRPRVIELPDPEDFPVEQEFKKAIGGIQFVPGPICRMVGYNRNGGRAQQPFKDGNWKSNIDDKWFRRSLYTEGTPIDVAGLIRLRHKTRGSPTVTVHF